MKKIWSITFSLLIIALVQSQPGCPAVNAGADVSLPCGTNCTNLTATPFQTGATNTYSIAQIPYTPFSYTSGTTVLVGNDDIWSCPQTLPFTFCFFGQSYTQYWIGANGVITFNNPGACFPLLPVFNPTCTYPIPGPIPFTNPADMLNTIMAPWHDIDPSKGGQIRFQVIGTTPCRILVVSWYQIPMFSCNNLIATSQLALYETTNAIEIYIQNKPICNIWNGGYAIEGIQDATGTDAYAVPGRNHPAQWSVQNDAWRFSPNGTSIVTVDWLRGATPIGTGNTVNVCPGSNTTYTARATYLPCSGGTPVVVTDDVNVTLAGALQAGIDSSHNVSSCIGGNNGAAYAHASTTNSGLAYGWSNGSSALTITGLTAGTYIFTATDASLCTRSDTVILTQPPPMTLNVPDSTNLTCSGTGTGTLIATPSGGTGPYSYVWNSTPVQNDSILDNVIPGMYTATVTDLNGCSASDNGVLTISTGGNNVTFNPPVIINVSCFGGSNGSITAAASGGNGTYTYNWSNGQSGATDNGLIAGQYTVSVVDGGGCTSSACYTVSASAAVAISLLTQTNVSCAGGSDGSISVSVAGGTPPYTYLWTNGQSTATASNLSAGNNTVTVTDANSCAANQTYNITELTALLIDSANVLGVGCYVGAAGSISVFVSGGTPNYTYNWVQQSNSQNYTGQTISGLSADTYNLTVTDFKNCTVTFAYQINQVSAPTFSTSSTSTSCPGVNDGTATVTVNTGTPPYSYNWNGTGASSNATLTGVGAGNADVTITDANCSATATIIVAEPTPIVITQVSETMVSCNGGSDGTETVLASGGTPGYNYNWSNLQTGPSATALSAGPITLTVSDAKACIVTQTFMIAEPLPLTGVITAHDAKCYDAPNGSSEVLASGGTPPYSYLWKDLQTNDTAVQLHAGNYFCTVTDANSCSISLNTTVNEPDNMVIGITVTAVKCAGDKNGTITVSATGGTGPYDYSATQDFTIFTSATDGVIQGLAVGTYTVLVNDDNGCTKTIPATIPNANQDNFTTSSDSTSCYGADYSDGAAYIVSTTLQNAPYTFAIDGGDSIQFSGDFFHLLAGSHEITATNRFGCVSQVPVFVFEPLPIVVDVVPDTVFLPLGESQQVQVHYLNASGVTYAWTASGGLSCTDCPDPIVAAYQRGDYVITVSTENGTSTCFGSATLHVEVEPHRPLFIPNSFSPNGDGNNDLFLIFGEGIETVDLKIFNRWGELVYISNNQFSGWDGTYKGLLQLPQVFTYVAKVNFLDHKKTEKEGTVTLVR